MQMGLNALSSIVCFLTLVLVLFRVLFEISLNALV